jgi:hypothetical protein
MTTLTQQDFLTVLCADLRDSECQELRTFHRGGERDGKMGPRWFGVDPEHAAAAVRQYPADLDGYYGLNPRRRAAKIKDQTGKKSDVSRLRFAAADIDDKHFADGRAGAVAVLKAFPLEPTTVIDSGGGLQALWQIEPLVLVGPDDPQIAAFEAMQARLYKALGGMDAVQDSARVFRLPGTHNAKYSPPRPVEVLHHDPEAVYTFADFLALLPAPIEPERVAWTPPTTGGGRSAYDEVPSIAEMREILRFIPPGGDYTADWLRHLAAVHSVYPGPEGEAICAEWCDGKPGEIARKFASFKRDGRASDAASVGTLIYTAKQHGYEPPRRSQASAKFTMPPPEMPAAGNVFNVLEMAQALDTAQRRTIELEGQLERCTANTQRLNVENSSLRDEVAAYKAAAAYPDPTVGGTAWDIAQAAFDERKRGNVIVEDGKEKARVCFKTAAHFKSATTLSNATKKNIAANVVDITVRRVAIETPEYKGEVDAAYYEIPPQCDTPAKFVLHLLSQPGEKKHGGARRKVELPEFDEPVAGPVRCVTEKRKLWSDLTTEKVVKVERIDSHTEHFDADGYQMTAAEVDAFNVSIGKKVNEPAYRPTVQLPLTPEDIELTTMPHFDLADEPRRPIPLHKECAQPGCTLPALKGEPLCSRHAAVHGYSMTGAD